MRPDRGAMLAWLKRAAVLQDGRVLSWVNAAKPGYAYPEAAGLVLRLLSDLGPIGEREERIARVLTGGVSPRGGVGRGGSDYVFDTAVALQGLLAFERAGGKVDDPAVLERMFDFIVRCSAERVAVVPSGAGDRWSTTYSPHLLKLVIVIDAWRARTSDPRCASLSERLLEHLAPAVGDWCAAGGDGPPRYVHAACYGAEGLIHLLQRGVAGVREGAERAAAWLAALQGEHGGLPAWSRPGPEARTATDATAQAIGIWNAIDASRFESHIERAWSHLAGIQHESGGLPYTSASADVNTWCTVFAINALGA